MGDMGAWITENWFDILSAVGIIGSVLFAVITLRSDTETRRVSNLLTLTQGHREIWSNIFRYPELARVLDASAKIQDRPVSDNEALYVGMIIQHLSAAYQALKSGLSIKPEALSADVRSFFSLPIPRAVWEKTRLFQNDDFAAFVEKCRRGGPLL